MPLPFSSSSPGGGVVTEATLALLDRLLPDNAAEEEVEDTAAVLVSVARDGVFCNKDGSRASKRNDGEGITDAVDRDSSCVSKDRTVSWTRWSWVGVCAVAAVEAFPTAVARMVLVATRLVGATCTTEETVLDCVLFPDLAEVLEVVGILAVIVTTSFAAVGAKIDETAVVLVTVASSACASCAMREVMIGWFIGSKTRTFCSSSEAAGRINVVYGLVGVCLGKGRPGNDSGVTNDPAADLAAGKGNTLTGTGDLLLNTNKTGPYTLDSDTMEK